MAEVSFGGFSRREGSPIYSQIVRYIKAGIVAGTVADGDEFPSRRALSALLGVNHTRGAPQKAECGPWWGSAGLQPLLSPDFSDLYKGSCRLGPDGYRVAQ